MAIFLATDLLAFSISEENCTRGSSDASQQSLGSSKECRSQEFTNQTPLGPMEVEIFSILHKHSLRQGEPLYAYFLSFVLGAEDVGEV
ncbi:hypothetical protein AVEN_55506-1 [Araneus ventricosus]|uniref:Uncharacterized protein n=1 Tax=Araneus ventricosus TaxID=182803 RepID=A0A4Y2C9F3_ARAVE|nr:hypothetical protein AVEN_55506-1 [Araneus ventricosus]